MDDRLGSYGINGFIPPDAVTCVIAACGMIIEELLREAAANDPINAIQLGHDGFAVKLRAEDPTFAGLWDSTQLLMDMRSETARKAEINSQVGAGPTTDSFAQPFSFGGALHALQRGHQVARAGWNGKGMWLALQVPDTNSKMSLPYIYMSTAQGDLVPWLASQTDMLAKDWVIA